ncbi:MAG: ABC transporter substrate-binding protein, partial [Alphaproteobacteria bacterium]
ESGGTSGEPVDLEPVQQLANLYQQWLTADGREGREAAWREMLDIYTDQVFTIGIVSGALQPVVVSKKLKNVPEEAVWAF